MKLLPLESKNTAGALKSSGAPSLPSKAPAIHVFSTSGSAARRASVMAVRMYCDIVLASMATSESVGKMGMTTYAGGEGVDSDSVLANFLRHGSTQLVHGGFACVVGAAG